MNAATPVKLVVVFLAAIIAWAVIVALLWWAV